MSLLDKIVLTAFEWEQVYPLANKQFYDMLRFVCIIWVSMELQIREFPVAPSNRTFVFSLISSCYTSFWIQNRVGIKLEVALICVLPSGKCPPEYGLVSIVAHPPVFYSSCSCILSLPWLQRIVFYPVEETMNHPAVWVLWPPLFAEVIDKKPLVYGSGKVLLWNIDLFGLELTGFVAGRRDQISNLVRKIIMLNKRL